MTATHKKVSNKLKEKIVTALEKGEKVSPALHKKLDQHFGPEKTKKGKMTDKDRTSMYIDEKAMMVRKKKSNSKSPKKRKVKKASGAASPKRKIKKARMSPMKK